MTTNYEKIKNMTIEEMAKFLQKNFDQNEESFGCYSCIDYQTHHYPKDCQACYWLTIGGSIEKWLQSESEV